MVKLLHTFMTQFHEVANYKIMTLIVLICAALHRSGLQCRISYSTTLLFSVFVWEEGESVLQGNDRIVLLEGKAWRGTMVFSFFLSVVYHYLVALNFMTIQVVELCHINAQEGKSSF